jgi:hypothetical protein
VILGHHVAEHDHSLRLAGRRRVERIFGVAGRFADLPTDHDVDRRRQRRDAIARSEQDAAHLHPGIADDPNPAIAKPPRDVGGELAERRGRQDVETRLGRRRIRRPAERSRRSCHQRVRPHRMRVIVEAPDDEIVLGDEALLGQVDRVRFQSGRDVPVVVERRLVRDHEVVPGRRRPAQHVERRHPRCRDAADRRFGFAGLERIAAPLAPCHSLARQLLLNAQHDRLGGHRAPARRSFGEGGGRQ